MSMVPRLKIGAKVLVIPTLYLENKFPSHVGGIGKVKALTEDTDWSSNYVPEYLITLDRKTVLVPEYSLEVIK